MSKLTPPQRLVSPRRQQTVTGWRKPSAQEKVEQPALITTPAEISSQEFKDLPIADAAKLLGYGAERGRGVQRASLKDVVLYLNSQGFNSNELATFFRNEGGISAKGETGYILGKIIGSDTSGLPPDVKAWYESQKAITNQVLADAKERIAKNIAKLKASGKEYDRSDILRIQVNALPNWSDQDKEKKKLLKKRLAYEAKIEAWRASQPKKEGEIVTDITIGATDKETSTAKSEQESGISCPGTIETYKVKLKDGSYILVEALDKPISGQDGEDLAREKAEKAGYKVAWATKKFKDEVVRQPGFLSEQITVNIYEIDTQRGIKRIEALTEKQAIRKAKELFGLEVKKVVGFETQKLTRNQAEDRIKTASARGVLDEAEAVIAYGSVIGINVSQDSIPIRIGRSGYQFVSEEYIETLQKLPLYKETRGKESTRLGRAYEALVSGLQTVGSSIKWLVTDIHGEVGAQESISLMKATPEEVEQANASMAEALERGWSCTTTIETFKVVMSDGTVMYVEALDSPKKAGNASVKEKLEAAGYKPGWITKANMDDLDIESIIDVPDLVEKVGEKDAVEALTNTGVTNATELVETAIIVSKPEYQEAANALTKAGFTDDVPEVYITTADAPSLREFTIPNMAQFVRNNPNGIQILKHYGFSQDVLDTVEQFNSEALALVADLEKRIPDWETLEGFTAGERKAFRRAVEATLGVRISDLTAGEEDKALFGETAAKFWKDSNLDTKIAIAAVYDKDYTKGSRIASLTKDLQNLSASNIASQIALAPAVAVMTPIGKQLTLDEAKEQLSKDFNNELTSLKSYINKNGTFDVAKLEQDLKDKPELEQDIVENTGYKNSSELVSSLEYYNYGTTVTAKEWAVGGLTLALVALPFTGSALSTLGVFGGLIKHGVPASLAGIMMPDTIRLMKDKDVSVGNKVFVAGVTAALLSGAVWATGKFAFKELRQLAKPGTFEPSGVSLEVSIPRAQLRANMTPKMAQALVQDLEKVWGTTLPDEIVKAVGKFKTPADFQVWASAVVRQGVMSTHIKGVAGDVALGGIKGRANPLQAALNNNVLFSIKPDMRTYGSIIGKSKAGLDVTPKGSMEWWSPNFSGDVAGWYLGKVKQFVPGGKMLRFSPKDIKAYPPDIFLKVANQMQNSKVWNAVKTEAKGDNVTAMNILIQREVYRRALMSPKSPQALPSGIYPVFKFHWSREPSGQLRPTWELEMITPSGFSARTFSPVRHLDTFQTGGKATPKVAALTIRSPIEGRDVLSGQRIRLGQPMPVIIQATRNAIAEGKGLPTLKELYAAKYLYRPIATVQNIFSRGKLVRPRATEASMVTTPRVWRSRVIKYDKLKANPSDVAAKKTLLQMAPEERLSTSAVASKVEGHRADVNGRFTSFRDPYYHPIREYADNWVNPRVGVMAKAKIGGKDAYIVGQDSSSAAQPGVWDIIGGQLDARGKPLLPRPFGRLSIAEGGVEQFMSETGVGLRNVTPAALHLGKGTEHSAFGMYMINATTKGTRFKIPMNKWYDMVKGQWVAEPELLAIGAIQSGKSAMVTPQLYIELARRNFDVSKLVVVDRGLPTAGIRQYVKGTFEHTTLQGAKKGILSQLISNERGSIVIPDGVIILIKAKNVATRVQSFAKSTYGLLADEFVVPTSYRSPTFTGLVPTLRPPMKYAPTVVIERTPVADLPRTRINPEYVDLETLFPPSYILSTPRTKIKTYDAPRISVTAKPPTIKTYTPTTPTTTTMTTTKIHMPTYHPPLTTFTPTLRPTHKEPKRAFLPTGGKERQVEVPRGSIAWRQGAVWKYIPPPWRQTKPITLKNPPKGALRTGDRTPQQTIQMIGRPKAKVPKSASIDLGVVDIQISNYGKAIEFTGKGEETVAGHSIASATMGMSIPARGSMRIRGRGSEGYKKLAFGTSLRSLTTETYDKVVIPKKFADKALSKKLAKLKPKDITLEIKEARVTPQRRAEILKMLPDRVRREVELWESMSVEYAPIKRLPRVEKLPVIFRGGTKKKKEITPSAVMV